MTVKIAGLEDYKIANKFLSDFDFIGDVNQYNKSINLLQDKLGVRFYALDENRNKRKNKNGYIKVEDLSTSQLLRAEENNAEDIKLYEKFVLQNNIFSSYSNVLTYKKPSELRVKAIRKIEKYRKNEIQKIIVKSDEKM